ALAFLPLACQAHTHTADLHQIERKGHILSGKAQALIDQDPKAKDSMWSFKDSSGRIFRIPQSGQPQQTGPYGCEDESGNILTIPRSTK
ncbi:MAG: hypothetical protein WAU47_10330, partial [Desulfobaccales bacterium]